MNWDATEAKEWMFKSGMGLLEDGSLFAEGGELIYEAKWGNGCDSEKNFRATIKRICWWEDYMIDDVLSQFMN